MTKEQFDPQLHILRSIANSLEDDKQRQEAQSARFNLFAALTNADDESARNWLNALEVSLALATIPNATARARAEAAINAIRRGIGQ